MPGFQAKQQCRKTQLGQPDVSLCSNRREEAAAL